MGHEDEIDIVALHWCVTHETGTGGGGAGAGRAVLDGVVIGKHTDLSTVRLVEAAATGQHLQRATITLERGGTQAFPFLVVELEDVVVTRVNFSWSGGMPDEEVALGFGQDLLGVPAEPRGQPGPVLLRPPERRLGLGAGGQLGPVALDKLAPAG